MLIIKTGALGDVLRTTSILPGLVKRDPELRVTWLTAPVARELVENHPLVAEVITLDSTSEAKLRATRWDRVLSFDDEEPLCELASALDCERLSGATLGADGSRTYTDDVEPWFGMGLLSKAGKASADAAKLANQESHAIIFARMLDIEMGETKLPLRAEDESFGAEFAAQNSLVGKLVVGLNTGAGGRWTSKQLEVDKTVDFAAEFAQSEPGTVAFVVLGGPSERSRNLAILDGIRARNLEVIDAGSENTIGQFAAIVSQLSLLLTSDSLALHVGVARRIPITAFFAPTSAAEIELYGRGEKVRSTAADYCTYRREVDTATITTARLVTAARKSLANHTA